MGLFRRKEKQEPVKAKSAPVQKKTVKSGKKRNKNYKIENRTNYGNILSAEQKREIVKQKKKEAARRDVSVQNTVPYQYMSKDGICQVNNHYFTRCISFEDIGYSTSDLDVKSDIFNAWCDFYNFFTDTMRLQIFCISQPADMVRMEDSIIVPTRDDEYNEIRTDLNDILRHQLQKGNNGYSRMKYIVFGIEGKSVKDVRKQINLLADEIRDRLSNMDVNSHVLSGYEWLCVLRHVMMPKNFDELLYNFDLTLRTGLNSKDFIVPASMSFRGFKN